MDSEGTVEAVFLAPDAGEEMRPVEDVDAVAGRGLREPCGYMASLAESDDATEALVHRGGLEADIVESGAIAVGDPVTF